MPLKKRCFIEPQNWSWLKTFFLEHDYYTFPIGGLLWYEISAFSHQNPCLQALFKLFSTKCLAIDLSSHDKVCCKGSLGSVINTTWAVIPVISLIFRNNSHVYYQNNTQLETRNDYRRQVWIWQEETGTEIEWEWKMSEYLLFNVKVFNFETKASLAQTASLLAHVSHACFSSSSSLHTIAWI